MTILGKYKRNVDKSILFEKSCKEIIPAASSTLAKSPSRLCHGYSPFYATSAKGSRFIDIDGNEWLDCEMGMGAVIWGHCREEVDNAMIEQIRKGVNFSVPSTLEYELGEILIGRYKGYDAVKFMKNGADAVYAAIRSARFITGREKTISCGYHGWLDWSSYGYYKCTPHELGIIDSLSQYNISCNAKCDEIIELINRNCHELACIVICPANFQKAELLCMMEICEKNGILVVFDEVTSGMRFARGGVAQEYHLYSDYLCISKGLANGMPLAAVMGNKEEIAIMEKLKITNAHASESLSLAAAIACEKLLGKALEWPSWKSVTDEILEKINAKVTTVSNKVNLSVSGNIGCFSITSRQDDFLNDPFRMFFIKYLSLNGIFTKGYVIFSDMHTKGEIDTVGDICCDCIGEYANSL